MRRPRPWLLPILDSMRASTHKKLETAVREKIATVTIIMNNNEWGEETEHQRNMFPGRIVGSDITNPRFDKLAELFGARGFYVERAEDVGDALKEALALDLPSLIEIPVDPDELPVSVQMGEVQR